MWSDLAPLPVSARRAAQPQSADTAVLPGLGSGPLAWLHAVCLPPLSLLSRCTCYAVVAGWAHNTLFISELASTQAKVPGLAAAGGSRSGGKRKAKGGGSCSKEDSEDYSAAEASESSSSDGGAALPDTPPGGDEAAAVGGRPVRRPRRRVAAGRGVQT